MPTRRWVRPVLIIVGILSVLLIALIIAAVVISTVNMNWNTAPVASTSLGYARSGGSVASVSEMAPGAPSIAVDKQMIAVPSPVPPVDGTGATADQRAAVGAKIIQTGSLTLRVDDANQTLGRLKALAAEKGGYVSDSNASENNGEITASITLRIPSAKFNETVDAAKKLASTVLDESTNAQDVTAQFIDLQARLTAAKAEEQQYLQILQKAVKVDDILQVTQYLSNVRAQIEQLQGQINQLTGQTDYATLSITLVQSASIQAPTPTWKPLETARQAAHALIIALQALVDVLITVVIFAIGLLLPIVLVLGLVIWLVRLAWRRIFRKR